MSEAENRIIEQWKLLATVLLAAGLLAGCPVTDNERTDAPVATGRDIRADEQPVRDLPAHSITLFANNPNYRQRPEPEKTVTGRLSRVAVRTGPDTREHPIRLRTDNGDWGVYSEGISSTVLDSIVDRQLRITGKWVDQSSEDAPVEVWLGVVTPID